MSQRTASPTRQDQVYRFWRMPEPEPLQEGPLPQDAEGQSNETPEQQAPKDKKCQRCGAVGQYSHGDGLLCVDCFDELVSFRNVACACGAAVGEPCRTKSGRVLSKSHKTRLNELAELNRKG